MESYDLNMSFLSAKIDIVEKTSDGAVVNFVKQVKCLSFKIVVRNTRTSCQCMLNYSQKIVEFVKKFFYLVFNRISQKEDA